MFWENHPILGQQGEVLEVQAVGRDITTRRNALEALRQSEERFSGIFRGSPEAIGIIRQSDGAYVEVNPSWETFFEIERSSAIGSNPVDLGILARSGASWDLHKFLVSGKSLRSFELSFTTRGGRVRWTSLSCELARLNDQPCYIVMHKDITERREAEKVRQNLAHATKLAMLGELTASIAHEINQPLGAILSNADTAEILLDGDSPCLPEIRQIITDIRRDDLRASQIIRKIRGMIGKREMTPEPLDANELIRNIEILIAHDIKRHGVKLMHELAPDLPAVNGDRIHLEQLLLNLVLNAIDALQRKHVTERWIVIRTLFHDGDQLEISVEDNGPGIPPTMLTKIFDSFFTTKNTGMGLGLALSMSIAEAHGGRLAAKNNPHGGTTLRLVLPALIPEYAGYRDRDTVCLPC
jgi:PAS domain S-box-containing protein